MTGLLVLECNVNILANLQMLKDACYSYSIGSLIKRMSWVLACTHGKFQECSCIS